VIFVLLNGMLEQFEELLRVGRARHNARMNLFLLGVRIHLSEIDDELERVVADLKVVRVLALKVLLT
jgi:hypothetical protein